MIRPGAAGGVCAYEVVYYPTGLSGLSITLTGPRIVSGDAIFAAENIFQTFVEVSTNKELKKYLDTLMSSLNTYEALHKK